MTKKHPLQLMKLPESPMSTSETRELHESVKTWLIVTDTQVKMGSQFRYQGHDLPLEELADQMKRDKCVGYNIEKEYADPDKNRTLFKVATQSELLADLRHIQRAMYTLIVRQAQKTLLEAPRCPETALYTAIDSITAPDLSEETRLYYAVAVKQLIWQVKQKLAGRRSESDIFVVFFSETQGSGKSEWVVQFAKMLDVLFLESVDFGLFTDDFRKPTFSRFYLALIDEMGKANKDEMEALKRAITAQVLNGRGIFTSDELHLTKNLSFVGTSNKPLNEDIQDSTGMRRWVEIHCAETKWYDDERRQALSKQIVWADVWNCVHVDDPAPYRQHFALFAARQATLVVESDFDAFCKNCFEEHPDGSVTNKEAFDAYKRLFGGKAPMNLHVFTKKMRDRYAVKRERNPVVYGGILLADVSK